MSGISDVRPSLTKTGAQPDPLLAVDKLRVDIHAGEVVIRAVRGVSFEVGAGEVLSLVGESGCGKTITAMSILRVLPRRARIVSGSIRFGGLELTTLPERRLRALRGNEIAVVLQDPMSSLDPTMKIGRQIGLALKRHKRLSWANAHRRAVELLDRVRIPNARRCAEEYPYQLSGGMRQRVAIAMALSCEPKLLVADEPTTALDVSVQAQVLELLTALRTELGMAMILITHDLGVVAEMADRVVVMYAGEIAETARTAVLFDDPRHPYTRGLIQSIPRVDRPRSDIEPVPGSPPNLATLPPGCAFEPRCACAEDICRARQVPLEPVAAGHWKRCLLDVGAWTGGSASAGAPLGMEVGLRAG